MKSWNSGACRTTSPTCSRACALPIARAVGASPRRRALMHSLPFRMRSAQFRMPERRNNVEPEFRSGGENMRNFVLNSCTKSLKFRFPSETEPEGGGFNFALILAAAAVVVIVAAIYFSPGRQSPPGAAPRQSHFAFGPAEQAYAAEVHIENIALTRAENFIHQEVTTLTADLVNRRTGRCVASRSRLRFRTR